MNGILFGGLAVAAPGSSFDEPLRLYAETQVELPLVMWFTAEHNLEARVVSFELQAVVDCDPGRAKGRRWTVPCTVEDAMVSAAAKAGDAGLLPEILPELDERLTGASVVLHLHEDGRLLRVDLPDPPRATRRVAGMHENLGLMLERALAGLDLLLPPDASEGTAWPQYGGLLAQAPVATGSAGATHAVHRIESLDTDVARIATDGRAIVEIPGTSNRFEGRVRAHATVDAGGRLLSRSWTVAVEPTASSALAEGTSGLPYTQRGRLWRLAPDEGVDLGVSREQPTPARTPSALQQDHALGLDRR